MLKQLLILEGAQELSKNELKQIKGSGPRECISDQDCEELYPDACETKCGYTGICFVKHC